MGLWRSNEFIGDQMRVIWGERSVFLIVLICSYIACIAQNTETLKKGGSFNKRGATWLVELTLCKWLN